MAEQLSSADPINYGLGTGWLDYYNMLSQMLTQQGAAQGSVGGSVLDQLTKLLTSPTSGPLGLAATAAYGNPQGIAKATNGQGFDNSKYQTNYDTLLNDLLGYTHNINKSAADAPLPIDPNKAPAPTPENAAKAPNQTQEFFQQWPGYTPEQQAKLKSIAAGNAPGYSLGGIVDKMLNVEHPQVPAFGEGGTATATPTPSGTPGPSPAPSPTAPKPAITAPEFPGAAGEQDPFAKFGGKDLVDAMQKYVAAGGDANKFVRTVGAIGKLNEMVTNGKLPVAGVPPVPGQQYPSLLSMGPDVIREMLARYGSTVGMKDGGVTLAGQPHAIVDAQGTPVAQITEDGKPENVRGLANGGVEVTPLTPDRYTQYTGKTPGDEWGRMLARMEVEATPHAATGQKLLFPDYAGDSASGQVDTSPGPGTNEIPSFGGTTTPIERGPNYGAGAAPKSIEDLFRMTSDAPGQNYFQKFARLLGGSLAGNTTMGDAASALNAGRAPTALPSSQQLSTMSPAQRSQYEAMLQQMGIVQSPEDFAYYVKQFQPAGLG